MPTTSHFYGLVLTFSVAVGCTARIDGQATRPDGQAPSSPPAVGSGGTATFEGAPPDPLSAGPLPLRFLSQLEYQNTVRDLLGLEVDAARSFPPESQAETGFLKPQKLDQVGVAAYQAAALDLGQRAVVNLPALLGCDPSVNEPACLQSFVTSFGRKAYRRPLANDEVSEHMAFYNKALAANLAPTQSAAVALLVAAMLESPHFLYRWELGSQPSAREVSTNGQVLKLNPQQVASQLSYFLWTSMPDGELFAAADAGLLGTPSQLEQQARRMLADPKAERTIAAFHRQWLGVTALPELGKSKGLYPTWGPALGAAMAEEVSRFTTEILLRGDGRVVSLFTSRASFVNEPLAALYGLSGVTGDTWQARDLPGRSGLLARAGFLAAHSGEMEASPILRGKFVRERLLCDHMPSPPDGIPPLAPPSAQTTVRGRHLAHSQSAVCSGCHSLMDEIGFAFDNYDAIGAYHELEGTLPIDVSGHVNGLDGVDVAFAGPSQLMDLLASSEQVRSCLAKEWFRYTLVRREHAGDRASFDGAYATFAKSGFDVRELLVAFATSRSFSYRALDEGETFQ